MNLSTIIVHNWTILGSKVMQVTHAHTHTADTHTDAELNVYLQHIGVSTVDREILCKQVCPAYRSVLVDIQCSERQLKLDIRNAFRKLS